MTDWQAWLLWYSASWSEWLRTVQYDDMFVMRLYLDCRIQHVDSEAEC